MPPVVLDHREELGGGLLEPTELRQHDRQLDAGLDISRIELESTPQGFHRRLRLPEKALHEAQIALDLGLIRS